MRRYYLELGIDLEGEEILLPKVIKAASDEASERIARQTHPTARLLSRHDEPLSKDIDPLFKRVDGWKNGSKFVPIGDFRDAMEVLLQEGARMAGWRMAHYSPFDKKIEPTYGPLSSVRLHEQVPVDVHIENGAEFIHFPDKEEALWFMATMLRESMAQTLQKITRGN